MSAIDEYLHLFGEPHDGLVKRAACELAQLRAELKVAKSGHLKWCMVAISMLNELRQGYPSGELGELDGVIAIRKLRAELDKWTEREAAICPEDVGFDEYIGMLQRKLAAANKAVEEARELAEEEAEAISSGIHNDMVASMHKFYTWLTAHPANRQDKEQE